MATQGNSKPSQSYRTVHHRQPQQQVTTTTVTVENPFRRGTKKTKAKQTVTKRVTMRRPKSTRAPKRSTTTKTTKPAAAKVRKTTRRAADETVYLVPVNAPKTAFETGPLLYLPTPKRRKTTARKSATVSVASGRKLKVRSSRERFSKSQDYLPHILAKTSHVSTPKQGKISNVHSRSKTTGGRSNFRPTISVTVSTESKPAPFGHRSVAHPATTCRRHQKPSTTVSKRQATDSVVTADARKPAAAGRPPTATVAIPSKPGITVPPIVTTVAKPMTPKPPATPKPATTPNKAEDKEQILVENDCCP